MPESDRSRLWRAAEVMVGTGLVVLPASLGGAPEWTAWLLAAISGAALLLWAAGAAKHHRRWGWHPLLVVPSVLVVVGCLQLVPLPPALLELFSPRQAALRDFALVPLGLEAWRPVAVDATAAAKGLARVLSLGMLFFVSLELGRVPGVRHRLLAVLALAGAATAVCGFVHLLAGLDALVGVFHFYGTVPLVTPFGNTNHLAAWLLLSGTVALGLSLGASSRDASVGWGVAALLCGVGVFMSYSRGGVGSFVATWVLVAAAALGRKGGLRAAMPWLVIGGTVAVAGLLSLEQLLERAETLSSIDKLKATKLELWPMFWRGLAPYWRLGMGLGGFELGFAPAQDTEFTVSFTHPESLWLQWVADVGAPVALGLFALVAWCAARLWRVVRGLPLERTAFLALLGLGLHDLFDFALELNAVAPAAVVVLGLLAALEEPARRTSVRRRGFALASAPIAACVGLLGFALPGYLTAEHRLAKRIGEGGDFTSVRSEGLRLIDRHPADWVLYSNVAQLAASKADPREALAWINRVLTFRPHDATAHVAAAHALLRLGNPQQALGELRLAWQNGDQSSLSLGLGIARKLGLWERVVLDRPGHLTRAYAALRGGGHSDDARALLDAAALFPPSDEVGTEVLALSLQHEIELGSPARALATADALSAELRERSDVVRSRALALQKLGRVEEALAELERLQAREPSNLALGYQLIELLAALGRPAAARGVLERLRPFAVAPLERSALFQREAALWLAEDRLPRALDAFQTASRIEPGNASLHYRLAEVYERMGSLHSALDEVRRGRLLDSAAGARAQDGWINRLEAALGQIQ